jgi:hypothetical protein
VKESELVDVRDVPLDQWGRALLEEVLFRAAGAVSARGSAPPSFEVELRLRVTALPAEDALEIRTECAAEPPLITKLSRPF